MNAGTLVLFSGGLDSTALLARRVAGYASPSWPVEAVSINYGQRHIRELEAAERIAGGLDVGWGVVDLSVLANVLESALTGDTPVPHGHYAADTMAATVVPNRNAIMLMTAVGIAASRGLSEVVTAVHAGDHFVYPDCRPEFIEAVSQAAQLGTAGMGDVHIRAPFVDLTKADVVRLGASVGAPFHLSWSCYEGGGVHCGRCGTCVERAEAFHEAGVPDPTTYADADYWRTVTA